MDTPLKDQITEEDLRWMGAAIRWGIFPAIIGLVVIAHLIFEMLP